MEYSKTSGYKPCLGILPISCWYSQGVSGDNPGCGSQSLQGLGPEGLKEGTSSFCVKWDLTGGKFRQTSVNWEHSLQGFTTIQDKAARFRKSCLQASSRLKVMV